ncbi:MAG: acyl-CoA dehydrogenase family protein, partial [Steroidobacteraceae bacterium]
MCNYALNKHTQVHDAADTRAYTVEDIHMQLTALTASFDDWRARSPFYDETHEAVAQSVRRFVQREVVQHIEEWEAAGEVPRELNRKAGSAGILGLGFPEEYGGTSAGIDIFHSLAQSEELAAPGAGGFWSAVTTHAVALPAVLALGSEAMKQRVAP